MAACRLRLQPLSSLHLDRGVHNYHVRGGNPAALALVAVLAVAVLLAACANHTVLAVGVSTGRAREVAMRRVVGAGRGQLMRQFLGEAALLSAAACAVGAGLAEVLLPAFAALAGQPLGWTQLAGWRGPVVLGGMLAVTVLGAGVYPAWLLARHWPAVALRGQSTPTGRSRLLRGLLCGQCALAVGLVLATGVVRRQWDFLRLRDVGFRTESLAVVPVPRSWPAAEAFRGAAAGLAAVESAATSDRAFTLGWRSVGLNGEDGTFRREVRLVYVDPHYVRTLGLGLVAGRDLDPGRRSDVGGAVLVNETLARELRWPDPVGQAVRLGVLDGRAAPVVVGVVRDYNFEALHSPVHPVVLTMDPAYRASKAYVFVRLARGVPPPHWTNCGRHGVTPCRENPSAGGSWMRRCRPSTGPSRPSRAFSPPGRVSSCSSPALG
ncbi:MAG: FtsX-like permease family protein [Candidatus Latescibacterota bacterium]